MDNQEIMKIARAEEFWNQTLGKDGHTNLASFFGGTHLKNVDAGKTVRRVNLSMDQVHNIFELCNHSDVLTYHFYATTLSMLLSYYETDYVWLSPLQQFEHAGNTDTFFLVRPEVNPSANFKTLFSSQKESLLKSMEHSINWKAITSYFENTGSLEALCQFGLVVENSHNFYDSPAKTQFHFVLDKQTPYLEITVNGELFDAELLTLFGENFSVLLGQVLLKTYEPLESLAFRSDKENEVLKQINTGKEEFSTAQHVVNLIESQCEERGDEVALKEGNKTRTYAQLQQNTNQLARYISNTFKNEKDDLFGVMLSRSIPMVESILAVWKAGSAYVPIGTDLPNDRLLQIVENSCFKAILTDNDAVQEQLQSLPVNVPIVHLKHMEPVVENLPKTALESKIDLSDLAYVIYTSGSTGTPKGVMIEHLGMINHIGAKISEMSIEPHSIVAQNAPHTFDISIWQFFAPLVAGGTCVIYPSDLVLDVEEFVLELIEDKVTILELVPSYLLEMLSFIENSEKNIAFSLEVIILNAETLTRSMVQRWLDLYPNIPIVNTYGATEVSDDTSHYFMHRVPESYSVPVMQTAIQNFEVLIANENLKLSPIGVAGEILLAGPCVGRGYFNDTEKTEKAFLQGPIAGVTSEKSIYKTGDLGRFMPDGTMEFIGRNDNQVKILGHRIELDGIGNVANEISSIKNAVAVANVDKQYIALYYLAEKELATTEIEQELLMKLPKYMMPSAYIHMDKFPLTTNGKIDKKKLPDADGYRNSNRKSFEAPVTEIEKEIALIWESILEVDKVGRSDHFFEMGGHSLKVMRLKNEYQKSFNVKLSLKDLFDHGTLSSHHDLIDAATKDTFINIEPIATSESYPISDAQSRLWVLSQFEEASVAYNIPGTHLLKLEDVEGFKKAVALVIERHEILRTVFRKNDQGEIRQFILNAEALNFEVDLQDFREHEQPQQAINDYVRQDSYRLFDLETGPLLRASLLRISENEYVFYYNMHHIISDGWSMEVLTKDVMTHYEANLSGVAVALTPLRIQYKDYASWQLTQQENTDYLAHREYWLSHLSGDIPLLDLPSQQVRPKVKTYNGGSLRTQLPKDAVHLSRAFVEAQGGSLFMLLLSALKVLLYGYTGETDIVIGTPVSGRNHFDLEDQIGFYINTLALRNQLSPEDDFTSFYQQLKENTLTSFDHQMYPFDRLTEDLNHRSSAGRSPLFDILIDMAVSEIAGSIDATYEIADSGDILTKYDLEFHFTDVNNELVFQINYNKNIYDHKMVEGLMKHFERLLSKLMAAPESEISSINYLSDAEENELLHTLNQTELAYSNETVIELFEAQTASNPDDIALVSETESLSYAELNQQANSFAHCLKTEHGIGVGDLVGVKLERDHWLLVAILGILKAGAGYVPIEPGMAASREGYMLQDSGVGLVITGSDFMLDFTEDYQGNIFTIDIEFDASQYPSTALSDIQANPTDLAYVIYTSGSTGTPKGTLIEHRSLTNYLLWCSDYYLNRDKEVSNFGLFTSISFDLTVTSLFLPLLNGGRLHIMPRKLDVSTTLRDYITSGISGIKLTPAHIMLMEDLGIEQSSLQLAIVGGDVLHPRHVEILRRINPQIRIYNEYGPTEATVGCIVSEVKDPEAISIGTPIANTQVYLLDAHGKLPPKGVVGEICIGGAGLARGYLGLDQLTKQKFIAHPFSPGARLYRTGDMGRWLKDGSLSFIGRGDDQVKVRGHRIELGEIEHRIREHSDIKEAALLVSELSEGDKELVAYIVADQLQEVSVLRRFLGEGLPDYMIPSRYIQVEEMPLTVNGKIDRKALLQTEGQVLSNGSDYVAPRNEIEEKLIVILSEELKFDADKIGVNDNFFDLGMNSLKLIKILEQFNREFNLEIKPISMFEYTTVNDFISNVFDDQQAIKEEDNSFESSEDLSQEIDDFITSMNE